MKAVNYERVPKAVSVLELQKSSINHYLPGGMKQKNLTEFGSGTESLYPALMGQCQLPKTFAAT